MNYHHGFDRLGNQVPPPKPDWQHRLIRWASYVTGAVCLFMLVWVR
ncbi:MAG: hypothetical protein Q8R67_08110 [Rhodoferax sp.]|nr:hypothetical protein [Rhodoferax sp.]MDP3651632.1 hypothetical protein [Rhodoferax sp.]